MVGSICAALGVFPRPEEEEESDPGEVTDGNIYWCGTFDSCVQGVDEVYFERPHSGRRRIFFLIGHQLGHQTKLEFFHAVVSGVVGLHG